MKINAIATAEDIGNRIRQTRLDKGISLSELARRVGLHRMTMIRIENGKHDTGVIKIMRVAKALSVPLAHLVEIVEEHDEKPKPQPERKRERIPGKPWL